MSSLTVIERTKIEKLLGMASGYVSNFSNSSFEHFFADTLGIDIHAQEYLERGSSKANKLRRFWELESDHLVGKSLLELVKYEEDRPNSSFKPVDPEKHKLAEQCKAIALRLMSGKVNLENLKETAVIFDARHLRDQIHRMEQSIQTDPTLAIGTAKELIETCCKTILTERGNPVPENLDIPTLTKTTLKALKLVPEGVSESVRGGDVIKRLLQNLGAIGNALAELRSLYGTGHGKHGQAQGLSPRHARLAVGAASTLATFLFDTHKHDKSSS